MFKWDVKDTAVSPVTLTVAPHSTVPEDLSPAQGSLGRWDMSIPLSCYLSPFAGGGPTGAQQVINV